MYCGDETGSFIGDVGSHTVRFGYGGEDNPKYVAPSYMACYEYEEDDEGVTSATENAKKPNTKTTTKTKTKQYIPSSCYQGQLASHSVRPIMRMPNLKDYDSHSKKGGEGDSRNCFAPQVHPNAFLQQGDVVQDWDALEQVWNTSMDVLRVRDTLKHTKGGTPYNSNNKNKKTNKNKNTTGETIQASTEGSKCVHPIMAVTPGHTHVVQEFSSSSSPSPSSSQYEAAVHREQRIKLTELLMETMQAPAVFLAPTPMLSAFCFGRQTALVVDVGAGGCRVTPVVDGLVLKHAQRRNGRGGDWLGNVTWRAMADDKTVLRPRYQLRTAISAARTKSPYLYRWAMQDVMYEFRTTSPSVTLEQWCRDESVPFLTKKKAANNSSSPPDNDKNEENHDDDNDNEDNDQDTNGSDKDKKNSHSDNAMDVDEEEEEEEEEEEDDALTPQGGNGSGAYYELPDGTHVDLTTKTGRDLCRVPELLFTDDVPYLTSPSATTIAMNGILSQHHTLSNLPLHKLIFASLSAVGDGDVRKDLANNILLTGGSSLYKNLEQRLSLEVPRIVPSAYKCRVIASRNSVERSCSAWIGASVLTSLGSFQQMWLSRTEYEEYGATLAIQRFPG